MGRLSEWVSRLSEWVGGWSSEWVSVRLYVFTATPTTPHRETLSMVFLQCLHAGIELRLTVWQANAPNNNSRHKWVHPVWLTLTSVDCRIKTAIYRPYSFVCTPLENSLKREKTIDWEEPGKWDDLRRAVTQYTARKLPRYNNHGPCRYWGCGSVPAYRILDEGVCTVRFASLHPSSPRGTAREACFRIVRDGMPFAQYLLTLNSRPDPVKKARNVRAMKAL